MFTNKALAFGRRNRHFSINFTKSMMIIEQNAGRMNARRIMPKLQFLIILLILFGNFVEGMLPIGSTNPQQQLRPTSIEQQERENKQFLASLRIRALHNLQRSLETLSSLTANSLMLNAALQSSESAAADEDDTNEENSNNEIEIGGGSEDRAEANETQLNEATIKMAAAAIRSKDRRHQQQRRQQQQPPDASSVLDPHLRHNSSPPPTSFASSQQSSGATSSTTNSDELQAIRPHRHGVRRIRADLKQMPPTTQQEEKSEMEGPTTTTMAEMQMTNPRGASSAERSVAKRNKQHRRMRSTSTRHHGGHGGNGHHKRRRKGCPTVHGKDQLLCPTRNTQYDVCITREQLCDRIRDCPGGEDEDSRHCFFFRPLETSLKTISHAVLLLVDTVMREQEEHQQQMGEQRNEL